MVDELAFRADVVGEDLQEDHVGITFQEVRVAQQDMSVYQKPALRTANPRPRNRPTRGCGKPLKNDPIWVSGKLRESKSLVLCNHPSL
jgi:hypothetical protein